MPFLGSTSSYALLWLHDTILWVSFILQIWITCFNGWIQCTLCLLYARLTYFPFWINSILFLYPHLSVVEYFFQTVPKTEGPREWLERETKGETLMTTISPRCSKEWRFTGAKGWKQSRTTRKMKRNNLNQKIHCLLSTQCA